MAEARRSYLVCATQRSGSTLLCELLKSTGVAGCPEEYFEAMHDTGAPPHPGHFLGGLDRTGLGIRDDPEPPEAPGYSSLREIADYGEHLRRTFAAGTTSNGVFGAKLMFNQLDELQALAATRPEFAGLERRELLPRIFGEVRYVWVTRRDSVRQAVSMWKALQTRSWRSGSGRRTAPQYHRGAIDHLAHRFAEEDLGWQRLFAEDGIEPLQVVYERDLEHDAENTVHRVLRFIGVDPPADWRPPVPLGRQADTVTEQWVAAYHRDLDAARTPAGPPAR